MSRAHAIVFGASSGIGLAAAESLHRRGYVVSGLSRRASPGADSSHVCDVTDDASVPQAVAAAIAAHGPPDVMVYASGVGAMGRTLAVPPAAAREVFEVNFWGMDRAVRAVLPVMSERRRGAIVLVSSLVALRPVPLESFYAASKAAAARYVGCLSFEAAKVGVHAQMLHVGFVDTGFSERAGWYGMSAPPRGGSGTRPEDVGEAIAELVASRAPSAVLGWKERAIALGDRLVPNLYDRLLKMRGGSK
jgi:short-subunit dehydrogenase